MGSCAQETLGGLPRKVQPQILSLKLGGNGNHFYSIWYDSLGILTHNLPVSELTCIKAVGPPTAEAWGFGWQNEEEDSDEDGHSGIRHIPVKVE